MVHVGIKLIVTALTTVSAINTCVNWMPGFYIAVAIDSNGDVGALGMNTDAELFSNLQDCKVFDFVANGGSIHMTCGCKFLPLTNGLSTGYDQGSDYWCNAGKTALGAHPPNPNCTPAPPTTTSAPTTTTTSAPTTTVPTTTPVPPTTTLASTTTPTTVTPPPTTSEAPTTTEVPTTTSAVHVACQY
ncbi:Aste57867_8343 [Aphanomyces stellatus]|uniref:Aste57867_8343 protein n=1 Tax=Aphanomyces stellatus TaxID=120398 RepID=A0A485KK30_9STRA|nr:hypothetical protein As57867_008311 [Aphanomyces stellatus]VFT85230.1 Aste57867_8343 [Aphanomyces stellatus]